MHTQSSIRRAFTIVEMITIIAIAPVLMLVASGLFVTLGRDIPQATRLVQRNTTVLHMLDHIRRDMDGAVAVPARFGDEQADEGTLLIEQPEAVVCYRFEEGRMVRTLLHGQGDLAPGEERLWRVQDAVIEWQPWTRDGYAYAIEIRSHLRQHVAGQLRRRFAGSYVFFVPGAGKEGEVR